MLMKMKKSDKTKFVRVFELFQQVDMLFNARYTRMVNLRKIMANKMFEQYKVKFEIYQKMQNLASLSTYNQKTLNTNSDIHNFAVTFDRSNKQRHKSLVKEMIDKMTDN